MATLKNVKGEVKVISADGKSHTAKEGEKIKKGDTVSTGKSSGAEIHKDDGSTTKVGGRTAVTVGDKPKKGSNPGAVAGDVG